MKIHMAVSFILTNTIHINLTWGGFIYSLLHILVLWKTPKTSPLRGLLTPWGQGLLPPPQGGKEIVFHFLPLFISDFICLILSSGGSPVGPGRSSSPPPLCRVGGRTKPSLVKCSFLLIISATWQKSAKSLALTPWIGCCWNNGIIFSTISLNFVTIKTTTFSECF